MDTKIKSLIDETKIDVTNINRFSSGELKITEVNYDPNADTMSIFFKGNCNNTFVDFLDDYSGIIVDFRSFEVVGIFLDYFEKHHLDSIPSLKAIWNSKRNGERTDLGNSKSRNECMKEKLNGEPKVLAGLISK
jgi:hypothetical protein